MHWRKATWAVVIWTAVCVLWIATGIGAVSGSPNAGDAAYQAGAAIGATFIFFIWFLGFVVLSLVWFMTRPKANVAVYGPDGQKVLVSESEAAKRVQRGWSYTPTIPRS